MTPESTLLEAETRKQIDQKLAAAGWSIQDKSRINLYVSLGVAVREKFAGEQIFDAESYPKGQSTWMCFDQMDTDSGPTDYILFIDGNRSIYNHWRQVLDKFAGQQICDAESYPQGRAAGMQPDQYFDAFLIGLTATPTKKTIGFFNQNLVSEYTHEDAVVDEVNVGYDIYRIKTELTEQGNKIEAGTAVEIRDRLTKQKRLEVLDEQEEWLAQQLDRSVLAPNQIRTVIPAFKDKCLPECFPNRNWQGDTKDRRLEWDPKTLVFAKDDDHCDRINTLSRDKFAGQQICDAESYPKGQVTGMQPAQLFDEGNAFCKKITYKVGKKTAEESIKAFRTDPQFRIAVTVDMIATGTDIRPLECVMFMRDVKSQCYYEQLKGRGTRIISRDELHKVTPDAPGKSRFVLVDCVGDTETDKTETKSLETKPSVSTAKLRGQAGRWNKIESQPIENLFVKVAANF